MLTALPINNNNPAGDRENTVKISAQFRFVASALPMNANDFSFPFGRQDQSIHRVPRSERAQRAPRRLQFDGLSDTASE